MKKKSKRLPKKLGIRLTQEGWNFLVQLLTIAGYTPINERGRFTVREALQDEFYRTEHPQAVPISEIKDPVARFDREREYARIRLRINRLKPGHASETVTDTTLLALSQLRGLNNPKLRESPTAYALLEQISSPDDAYKIDFLRFVRRLTLETPLALHVKDGASFENYPPSSAPGVLNDKPQVSRATLYLGAVTFQIAKSFATLQLIPQPSGLRLLFCPIEAGIERTDLPGYTDIVLPLETVGGFLSTAIAFLERKESLDENVILQGGGARESDLLFKMYRDKPQGPGGTLSGEETCWFRIVTGAGELNRRRMLLSPRDLICWIEACRLTAVLAASFRTHEPKAFDATTVSRTVNPELMKRLEEQIKENPSA